MIKIEVSREARFLFYSLKQNFTAFEFLTAIRLRSIYAKRIYEMIAQFRNTGIMRIAVEDLKYRLGVKDHDSGKDKYGSWAAFERYVLEPAQKEINESADLRFDYEIIKEGRKFAHLVFRIGENRPTSTALQVIIKEATLRLYEQANKTA